MTWTRRVSTTTGGLCLVEIIDETPPVEAPTSPEITICGCGHPRIQHGRLLLAEPTDAHMGACWCGCAKFQVPPKDA